MKKLFLSLSLFIAVVLGSSAQNLPQAEFNAATYNLRLLLKSDSTRGDGWQRRCPVVASLIDFHDFDIFGTQECFRSQLDQLLEALPGYACIGVGRNDGKTAGEHSAIFYRTDLFELLDNGDFWLSETPAQPGKGWDAAEPRICSWGKFRHRPSGKEFMFFNLHMDHIGVTARAESARLVLERVTQLGQGLPTFLTGDFNVDQTSDPYRLITSSPLLDDSHDKTTRVYELNGTFNSFRPDSYTTSRLDHLFVSPEIEVIKYGILTDSYRTPEDAEDAATRDAPAELKMAKFRTRMPSDHFPVLIRARF